MSSVDSRKLPEFRYDLPQTALGSLISLGVTIFQNAEGSLWTHCTLQQITGINYSAAAKTQK
jgi:hypothetical protein